MFPALGSETHCAIVLRNGTRYEGHVEATRFSTLQGTIDTASVVLVDSNRSIEIRVDEVAAVEMYDGACSQSCRSLPKIRERAS